MKECSTLPNDLHEFLDRSVPGRMLGADEKMVQRVLRHAKSHVTKNRYIKTFDPALVAAMKKLEATVDLVNQSPSRVHRLQ